MHDFVKDKTPQKIAFVGRDCQICISIAKVNQFCCCLLLFVFVCCLTFFIRRGSPRKSLSCNWKSSFCIFVEFIVSTIIFCVPIQLFKQKMTREKSVKVASTTLTNTFVLFCFVFIFLSFLRLSSTTGHGYLLFFLSQILMTVLIIHVLMVRRVQMVLTTTRVIASLGIPVNDAKLVRFGLGQEGYSGRLLLSFYCNFQLNYFCVWF